MLCLILDSATVYGVFFVMRYLSITSFLCDTKQHQCLLCNSCIVFTFAAMLVYLSGSAIKYFIFCIIVLWNCKLFFHFVCFVLVFDFLLIYLSPALVSLCCVTMYALSQSSNTKMLVYLPVLHRETTSVLDAFVNYCDFAYAYLRYA